MNIPDKLDTGDTPLTEGGGKGGLAIFPPGATWLCMMGHMVLTADYMTWEPLYPAVDGSRTCPVKSLLRPQKRHPVQVCSQGTKRIGPGRMQKAIADQQSAGGRGRGLQRACQVRYRDDDGI